MGGIELENGGDEECHHPFVVDILQVGELVQSEKVRAVGEHQHAGHEEQQVAEQHDAAQTADGDTRTVVALEHLHRRKAQSTKTVDIRGQHPIQQAGTGTDDHQEGAGEEDGGGGMVAMLADLGGSGVSFSRFPPVFLPLF